MSSTISRILRNEVIAHDLYEMILEDTGAFKDALPGQFLHIKIPGNDSLLLRRPISINDLDTGLGRVHLVYQVVGKGTEILSSLKPGRKLDILGPLGNGFCVPETAKNIYIVGGGCGVAPLRFIGRKWSNRRINSFLGFRNKACAYQLEDFKAFSENLYIATDDGSLGERGTIINLLSKEMSKERPDLILACGPTPMLKELKDIAGSYSVPCQVSLEERMGCGVGGCLVCVCAVGTEQNKDYKKVCSHGPVFWSEEVFLDDRN